MVTRKVSMYPVGFQCFSRMVFLALEAILTFALVEDVGLKLATLVG